MNLAPGEKVFYKALPEVVNQRGTVISADDKTIVLGVEAGQGIEAGKHLMISWDEQQCFAEVVEQGEGILTLRRIWSNGREYFRVDDVVPMIVRKVGEDESLTVSRLIPFFDAGVLDAESPDLDVNPKLWQMLVNIQSMLGMVLERLDLETAGFQRSGKKRVNMSATGMRFQAGERYEVGEKLEIKMLLPARPPFGVIVYGSVIRVDDLGGGENEIALQFYDISDNLRDEIIRYSLTRLREIIRNSSK
ncbi:MAG: hypothetical protein AUK27_10150 [Deltaproteobacteria bacterium CG2_30_66_27]|nr:MAG: hypothetical protein AUK27_10150 [Deltaproteobacteria bacterium CG2_30_66_27]